MKTKLALSLAAAAACVAARAESLTCASPDGKNALVFTLTGKGEPTYSFAYRGKKGAEHRRVPPGNGVCVLHICQ